MQAGLYRDRVLVQLIEKTETHSGFDTDLTDVGTYWAKVAPISPAVALRYQQEDSVITHQVQFSQAVDITFDNTQIVHNGRTYRVIRPGVVPGGSGYIRTNVLVQDITGMGDPVS